MRDRTLCWKCGNCGKCSWSQSFKPVEGWQARATCFVDQGKTVNSYIVLSCPEFKQLSKVKRDRDFEFFSLFRIYKNLLKPSERAFLDCYFFRTTAEALRINNMPERTFYRRASELKSKLKSLESLTKILAEGNYGFEKNQGN